MTDLSRWLRENPNQTLAIAVGVLIIGAAGFVGTRARSANQELRTRRAAWEETASQLATVQQQFRPPTSTESASLIGEASQMGTLAVDPDQRLVLVDAVGRLAEACGLKSVRVNTVERSDSLFVPDRSLPGQNITGADYALSVEFSGGFAGVLQFVNTLPPSVSVARLSAARQSGGATYLVILSVFEFDGKSAG